MASVDVAFKALRVRDGQGMRNVIDEPPRSAGVWLRQGTPSRQPARRAVPTDPPRPW